MPVRTVDDVTENPAAPEPAPFDALATTNAHVHDAWRALDSSPLLAGLFHSEAASPTLAAAQTRNVLAWLVGRLEVAEVALEQAAGGHTVADQLAAALHTSAAQANRIDVAVMLLEEAVARCAADGCTCAASTMLESVISALTMHKDT